MEVANEKLAIYFAWPFVASVKLNNFHAATVCIIGHGERNFGKSDVLFQICNHCKTINNV